MASRGDGGPSEHARAAGKGGEHARVVGSGGEPTQWVHAVWPSGGGGDPAYGAGYEPWARSAAAQHSRHGGGDPAYGRRVQAISSCAAVVQYNLHRRPDL